MPRRFLAALLSVGLVVMPLRAEELSAGVHKTAPPASGPAALPQNSQDGRPPTGPTPPAALPQNSQDGRPPTGPTPPADFETLAQSGIRALYNLNYDEARASFQTLSDRFPDNPLGPYSLTTLMWWELTNEYDENDRAVEKRFMDQADRSIKISRRMMKKGDPTGEIHLCLGGALGLKARWEAIQGHWLRAYLDGKEAFTLQERALEINPGIYDACLGVGIFHYYTATLPAVIKILARFVFGGNREQGLAEIRLAMTRGRFSRTAAQLFLVGIYNGEKKYKKALSLLREGRKEYPQSSFFHYLELLLLESAGEGEALRAGAQDYIDRTHRGEPSYTLGHLHRGFYALGNSYLIENKPREALALYDDVLARYHAQDRWISLTYLHRGHAYDLLGERAKALADYRMVRSRRDVWELHDQANRFIDKPYTGRDPLPPENEE